MFFKENVKQDNDAPVVDGVEINDMADYNNFLIESEESWGNLQVAAMAASHQAIVENDESLMEGVVRDYWEKVKEFFQKLWAALKQFVSNVWGRISALWMNKVKWVNKYKKAIMIGASNASKKKVQVTYLRNADTFAKTVADYSKPGATFSTKEEAKRVGEENLKKLMTDYEHDAINPDIVKAAMEAIASLANAKKNIDLELKNTEAHVRAGLKIAEAEANYEDNDTKKEEAKQKIEEHKKQIKLASKYRTVIISAVNKAISVSFAVCKKAYSYGPSTKTAYKSGSATMGENTSILEQYGYQG